jgi:hypothetical protein
MITFIEVGVCDRAEVEAVNRWNQEHGHDSE